jgi:hypothetical protein
MSVNGINKSKLTQTTEMHAETSQFLFMQTQSTKQSRRCRPDNS